MINKTIYHYKNLVSLYTNAYPNSVKEFNESYSVKFITYIKAWFGVLYLLALKIDHSRVFYFESFRNSELMDLIPPDKITILGGNDDKSKSSDRGYGFFWIAGIVAAIIVAAEKGNLLPLKLQVLICKWKLNGKKKYFLLYEDTLPVGTFFALLGNECNIPTICIQHGFGTAGEILFDGQLCRHNFLYSLSQEKLINAKQSVFYELGPPFEVRNPVNESNEIILIGTGWKGLSPAFYEKSLAVYGQIKVSLEKFGWQVMYRPHPNENDTDYSQYFSQIDKRSKIDCLSDSRKIYIGYISTLLYEAKIFGHGVINIKDKAMPELAFNTHLEIDISKLHNIDSNIRFVHQKISEENVEILPPLETRFFSAFNKIAYR